MEPFDIDHLLELERVAFAGDAFSKDTFLAYYRKCSELFLVAELNGLVVAYVITEVLEAQAVIASIAVDIGQRRKGIGSRLIRTTLNELMCQNVDVVYLRVRATNEPAIRFWGNFGFNPDKEIPNFYYDGTQALQMLMSLRKQ